MAHHLLRWRDEIPPSCRGLAIAAGNFDGVHLGHAVLIAELARKARTLGTRAAVLTFDPHPLALLRPHSAPVLLTTTEDRAAALQSLGADEVLTLRTEPALLDLSAGDFFRLILLQALDVKGLVEGPNFGFGKGREGDIPMLRRLCSEAGMPLTVVPWHGDDGSPISSSRVREALAKGDVAGAARLLGRPYRLRGIVGAGQKRGRTLGFPTANLMQARTVIPGEGVYAARAFTCAGSWPAAVNVGPNPTFGESEPKVEAHLIGYEGDLYGSPLALDFAERLRGTRQFAGAEALKRQLADDVAAATRILGEGSVTDAELLARVRAVVAAEVLPALSMDGTAVEVVGVDAGIVQVRLAGTCAGCPSSIRAVVMGIEEELLKRIPELRYLEAMG